MSMQGGVLVHVARGHPISARQMGAWFDLGHVGWLVLDVETHGSTWATLRDPLS